MHELRDLQRCAQERRTLEMALHRGGRAHRRLRRAVRAAAGVRARGSRAWLRAARPLDRLRAPFGEIMGAPLVGDIDSFIDEVLACCPMIRSIWLVADCANGSVHAVRLYTWDLIAFADPLSLERLRRTVRLHRGDVRLRVMGEGNRLERAWGGEGRPDVLRASDWDESNPGEGYYVERS